MKLSIVLLLLCIALENQCTLAQQHNLYFGNCIYDNNTMPIYSHVISMENHRHVRFNPKPVRGFFKKYFTDVFRRPKTTTTTPAPILTGEILKTTVVFPPNVSTVLTCFRLYMKKLIFKSPFFSLLQQNRIRKMIFQLNVFKLLTIY